MSAGYATRLPSSAGGHKLESSAALFERADAALYEAKRGGRMRAVAAASAPEAVPEH